MNYIETAIPGVWIIEPKVFGDARGYFMETWKEAEFTLHVGEIHFVQENESCSSRSVLRGLHFQRAPYSQAKLVRVVEGTVIDVAVDVRSGSPTFGKYVIAELSGENKRQLFIPRGFAHGFCVTSDRAVFTYKVDNPYAPAYEGSIRFDDPAIGIHWPIDKGMRLNLSEKDLSAPLLKDARINFKYPTNR